MTAYQDLSGSLFDASTWRVDVHRHLPQRRQDPRRDPERHADRGDPRRCRDQRRGLQRADQRGRRRAADRGGARTAATRSGPKMRHHRRPPASPRRGISSGPALGRHHRAGPGPAAVHAARERRRGVVVHRDSAAPLVRERSVGGSGLLGEPQPVAPARPALGRHASTARGYRATGRSGPISTTGWPPRRSRPCRRCHRGPHRRASRVGDHRAAGEPAAPRSSRSPRAVVVLNEEWQHRLYADRTSRARLDRIR